MVRVFQEYKTATINIFKKIPVCAPSHNCYYLDFRIQTSSQSFPGGFCLG
jgi:hypothetical protein